MLTAIEKLKKIVLRCARIVFPGKRVDPAPKPSSQDAQDTMLLQLQSRDFKIFTILTYSWHTFRTHLLWQWKMYTSTTVVKNGDTFSKHLLFRTALTEAVNLLPAAQPFLSSTAQLSPEASPSLPASLGLPNALLWASQISMEIS